MKIDKNLLAKDKKFIVKFWIKNKEGIKEQKEDSFFFFSADRHKQAEKECINKYRGRGQKIQIISVNCHD